MLTSGPHLSRNHLPYPPPIPTSRTRLPYPPPVPASHVFFSVPTSPLLQLLSRKTVTEDLPEDVASSMKAKGFLTNAKTNAKGRPGEHGPAIRGSGTVRLLLDHAREALRCAQVGRAVTFVGSLCAGASSFLSTSSNQPRLTTLVRCTHGWRCRIAAWATG